MTEEESSPLGVAEASPSSVPLSSHSMEAEPAGTCLSFSDSSALDNCSRVLLASGVRSLSGLSGRSLLILRGSVMLSLLWASVTVLLMVARDADLEASGERPALASRSLRYSNRLRGPKIASSRSLSLGGDRSRCSGETSLPDVSDASKGDSFSSGRCPCKGSKYSSSSCIASSWEGSSGGSSESACDSPSDASSSKSSCRE